MKLFDGSNRCPLNIRRVQFRVVTQSTSPKPITADDLLSMGDIGRCELINGELVMMSPAGLAHGMVAMRIGRYLSEFVEEHNLGSVFAAETGFKVHSNPDLVRAPDTSFIQKSRLAGKLPKGFFEGAPDLAVEVLSPDDSKREVDKKIKMWLEHGTTSVWLADPASRTIAVYRAGCKPILLEFSNKLHNEPMLPGFVMILSKVFKQP